MNWFLSVALLLTFLIFTVSQLLEYREEPRYSDKELREAALSRNMSTTPATYSELLKLVDSKENKMTKDKINLGRDLYHDKILSNNKDISCATCHVISKDLNDKKIFLKALTSKTNDKTDCVVCHLSDQSGVDRFETAVGDGGKENQYHLNTLSVLNSGLAKYQTWDASINTTEEQVGASIQDPYQMNLKSDEAVKRLKADKDYAQKFEKVFGGTNFENIEKAIGAYVKTLVTRGAYDRFLEGDDSAINEKAKKGLAHFLNFGCKGCHTGVTVGGQSIQKFPLRDYSSVVNVTNTFDKDENVREVGQFKFNDGVYHAFPFENKGGFLGKEDKKLFRVPMLRNVTKTSPYFHNGAVKKLREVVRLMGKHQLGMNFSNTQLDELIEFLKSLEGDVVDYKIEEKAK